MLQASRAKRIIPLAWLRERNGITSRVVRDRRRGGEVHHFLICVFIVLCPCPPACQCTDLLFAPAYVFFASIIAATPDACPLLQLMWQPCANTSRTHLGSVHHEHFSDWKTLIIHETKLIPTPILLRLKPNRELKREVINKPGFSRYDVYKQIAFAHS